MVVERLTFARATFELTRFTALLLLASACDPRTVYLVPFSLSSTGAGGAEAMFEAGLTPVSSGGMGTLRVDGGLRDGATATCGKQGNPQQPQPLGVYLMVDQSKAMQDQWDAVSAALGQFIQDSERLGQVSVGIQFYALDPNGVSLSTYPAAVCRPESYENPKVPIAPLPGNDSSLLAAIKAQGPSLLQALLMGWGYVADGTPRDAAIRGAVLGARRWATQNSGTHSKAVAVLVTSGAPAPFNPNPLCRPGTAADGGVAVAGAATGLAQEPKVSTYVLNVGPANPELDAIASAGGTDHAYSATTSSDMVHALHDIRELAVPCDVNVGANAAALADNRLNVELSSLLNGTVVGTRFGRVKSGASADSGDVTACKPNRSNEWYTEGAGDQITVHLCPSTCAYVRTVKDATLDVLVGCKTTTIE